MNDELSSADRRALLAMWCKVAWADGIIEDKERETLARMWDEFGEGAVTRAEISSWLASGVPFEAKEVSPATRSLFVKRALELARADGEVMPPEVETIRALRQALYSAGVDASPRDED